MNLTEALSLAIRKWEDEKPNRNLSMLKRMTSVSYSTIRRIVQHETQATSETALRIAEYVMSREEFVAFTERYLPTFSITRTDIAVQSKDDDVQEYLQDKNFVPILLLASHRKGTNEAEVRDFFGREAAKRFTELVNSGYLSSAGMGNFRLDRDLGSVSLETAREWLTVMASICPLDNDDISRTSLAHVGWESVNFETAVEVYHAAIDFVRRAVALTKDKRNKGDILIMFGSLFNVLKGTEEYK